MGTGLHMHAELRPLPPGRRLRDTFPVARSSDAPTTIRRACTNGAIACNTTGPMVILGTKWPSITSTWMIRTPASMTAPISSPKREKSSPRGWRVTGEVCETQRTGCSPTPLLVLDELWAVRAFNFGTGGFSHPQGARVDRSNGRCSRAGRPQPSSFSCLWAGLARPPRPPLHIQ